MKSFRVIVREGKKIAAAYGAQPVSTYAAAVAYFTIFSLAPILIIVLKVLEVFLSGPHAEQALMMQFSRTFGASGSDFAQTLMQAGTSGTHVGIVGAALGILLVIVGATGVFGAIETALNAIFAPLPEKFKKGFAAQVWEKVASLGMVLSIGFVLLTSLAISAILSNVSMFIQVRFPAAVILITVVSFVSTYMLVSLFLALLLKFIPSKRLPWRPALIGGFIAGVGFTVGKYALSFYFSYGSPAGAYGAASAIVLIILWAFYLSQVFFFAAILTKVYFLEQVPRKKLRKARTAT